MERHRVVFVLVDGIGDVAIPSLGFRTPLQATDLPMFDAIAAAGVNGLMDPVEPGLACGSDTAHLSILGYDPRIYYRGRGAFESMGAGLPMSPGDIAFKSNFAFMNDATGVVEKRRADRQFEEYGPVFCAALDGCRLPSFPEYQVSVRYATEHRCGVVVRGPGLSGNISGTDPLKDNLPLLKAEPLDELAESRHTASLVNELSDVFRGILRDHPLNATRVAEGRLPANAVLLRGCGIRIEVPTFSELHGFRGCMVAPTKIIAGLGMSLEMAVVPAQGATGDYGTSLSSKARTIVRSITAATTTVPSSGIEPPSHQAPSSLQASATSDGDPSAATDQSGESLTPCGVGRGEGAHSSPFTFGFLHIKAVDDAGHDRDLALKQAGLQSVDAMLAQLARALWEVERNGDGRYLLCVTGDHTTPVEYGDHSCEPVPFAAAYLRDVVDILGADRVLAVPMGDIPAPRMAATASFNTGGGGTLLASTTEGAPLSPEVGGVKDTGGPPPAHGGASWGMFGGGPSTAPLITAQLGAASGGGAAEALARLHLSEETSPRAPADGGAVEKASLGGGGPVDGAFSDDSSDVKGSRPMVSAPAPSLREPLAEGSDGSSEVTKGGDGARQHVSRGGLAGRGKGGAGGAPAHHGDSVCRFDEISAARGWLGRFPGSEVMGILKQLASANVASMEQLIAAE